jgi:geranylgeranyl diphosphate synthase type I
VSESARSANGRAERRLAPTPRTVVALPGRPAALETSEFLSTVDRQLAAVLEELAAAWAAEDAQKVDVLADRDLPQLLSSLASTGKRIRPTMCYWGWLAAGGRDHNGSFAHVVLAGTALELLHVFALVHDDVMDESASRRGQPSIHTLAAQLHLLSRARGSAQRFGESIAVLVGDLAHAEADYLVAGLPASMRAIWRQLVIELVQGQSRDITGSAAGRRDLSHARRVARMKSGAYTIERPLQLGAAAADASEAAVTALSEYGRKLGEAFALRDDLLGVWGNPKVTGKPAGDDLISGKPTVILALSRGRLAGAAREARERVGTPEFSSADVELLQEELRACGVVDEVESLISSHVHAAVDALDQQGLDARGITGLTQLAHRIAWRDR